MNRTLGWGMDMAKEERHSGGERAAYEGGRGGGSKVRRRTVKDQEEDWLVRPVGVSRDELLKWATKLATEVEGIIN